MLLDELPLATPSEGNVGPEQLRQPAVAPAPARTLKPHSRLVLKAIIPSPPIWK